MQKVTLTKLDKVNVPEQYQAEEGCVAFQMVSYVVDFFGNTIEGLLDTKILADGSQIVNGGDGYFSHGTAL